MTQTGGLSQWEMQEYDVAFTRIVQNMAAYHGNAIPWI